MLLRLSNLKLRGIIVLVVSKQKGITLVFKNDPLEKVDVTSTFDSISRPQCMFSGNTPYDTMSMPDLRYHTPLLTPNSEISRDLDSLDGYPGYSTYSTYSAYSNFCDLFERKKEEGLKAISSPKKDHKDHHMDGNRPRIFHRQQPHRRGSLPTWLPSSQQEQHYSQLRNSLRPANLQRHNQYQNFDRTITNQQIQQQEIFLQPSETSVAAQLATLMNSNHTISPYTRTLQHLTFRSYPHPTNKTTTNKRKSPGKVTVKRNILKFPGLTIGFGHYSWMDG
ncbi:4030_t:CDS:2 [Diversispora eburnea]|uniref:4030_t:CDS:1 n=1 Tax=Diversispora eburnea TaxID=1213867 RepID=A0A9N9AT97_9GLOM|nr:4030_t:CDS:2 [Diversispora eburnea]